MSTQIFSEYACNWVRTAHRCDFIGVISSGVITSGVITSVWLHRCDYIDRCDFIGVITSIGVISLVWFCPCDFVRVIFPREFIGVILSVWFHWCDFIGVILSVGVIFLVWLHLCDFIGLILLGLRLVVHLRVGAHVAQGKVFILVFNCAAFVEWCQSVGMCNVTRGCPQLCAYIYIYIYVFHK